jgi:hypothetical protein
MNEARAAEYNLGATRTIFCGEVNFISNGGEAA